MNCWNATGRFTKDPEIKTTQKDGKDLKIANFTLAVNKRYGRGADFIKCVAFGSKADVVEQYFRKGMKADITASITSGSYKGKDGNTVYTTTASIETIEFGESKSASANNTDIPTPNDSTPEANNDSEFMQIADDDNLPFNL